MLRGYHRARKSSNVRLINRLLLGGIENMVEFVHQHLWELFIAIEIVFWLCIVLFVFLRYVLGLRKMSIWILPFFVASVLADAYLGWIDYKSTGEFSIFQFIIVITVIYAITAGVSDFRRLDAYIQRKVVKWKGEAELEISVKSPPKYGCEHARHERYGWYMHVVMFVVAQIAFFYLFGTRDQFSVDEWFAFEFYRTWLEDEALGAYEDVKLNQVVRAWFIVLIIDGIISLSYTFFPRKEKNEE